MNKAERLLALIEFDTMGWVHPDVANYFPSNVSSKLDTKAVPKKKLLRFRGKGRRKRG